MRLAREDEDPRVRRAAIEHVDDLDAVFALCDDDHPEVADGARQRWVSLLSTFPEDQCLAVVERLTDAPLLTRVAQMADSVNARLASIARIDNTDTLTLLLESENHTLVHQACVSRLANAETLERIHKRFLDKDKNVARIAREKLQAIKVERQQHEAVARRCETLLESFEKLAKGTLDDIVERRLTVLEEEWEALVNAESPEDREKANAYRERIEALCAQCRELIRTIPEERASAERAGAAVVAELDAIRQRLCESDASLDALQEDLQRIRSAWPGLAQEHSLSRSYRESIAMLENLVEQYERCKQLAVGGGIETLRARLGNVAWPDPFKAPASLQQARQELERLVAEQAEHKERERTQVTELEDRLSKLESALADGHLKSARKLHGNITRRLDTATFEVSRKQKDHFAKLSQQLRELRDWQGFVTTPKRTALCESMEALHEDASVHPIEKAKAIKDLQDQWKNLGPSDSRESQQLWSRFKRAADQAYAPCAEFFQQQRSLREQNLAERQKICDSLETFLRDNDWDHADWKAVSDIVSRARREWRSYDDIPRSARNRIQTRFTRVLKQLEGKLKSEQERNHALKSALTERLDQLLAEEDASLDVLISEAKRAQREWKDIGLTDRRTDQKLWKAFRERCDRIFAKREETTRHQQEVVENAATEARSICQRLRTLVESNEIDKQSLNQLTSQFEQIRLGKPEERIRKEFKHQCWQAQKALEELALASRRQVLDEIRRKGRICQQLEQGDIEPEQADCAWESETELDPDILTALAARKSATNPTDQVLSANRKTAELLCVRAEILAELSSPADAQSLRMEYQVERLNRELSQGIKETRTPAEQFEDIVIEWYCLGPVPDPADLQLRFSQAEEKLLPAAASS